MIKLKEEFYETLEGIGLTKREITCYITILELGQAKSGEICKATSIPSSKIYEILNRLIEKGLIAYVMKDKIKYYQATDPNVLVEQIEEKKKRLAEMITELARLERKRIQYIQVYEGYKSIFSLFTDLIKDAKRGEEYFTFAIGEEERNERNRLFFSNLATRRKEKGLKVKLLKSIKYYKREKHTKLEIRYSEFELPQGITVFRDSTIILLPTSEPVAIKIENEKFTRKMKEFFLSLWKKAKR